MFLSFCGIWKLLSSWELRRPYFFKDPGLQACAALVNNKSQTLFAWIDSGYILFWLTVVFLRRCDWYHLFTKYWTTALESFTFGAILLFESSNKSRTCDPGCPRGCQHRSKGVPPIGSEKHVAPKTRHSGNQPCSWLQNGSQHLNICCIFGDISRCFSASFLGWILMKLQMVLESI